MSGKLEGKRIIVTGAGSGIGAASAALFASEGASVAAVDRSAEAAAETASKIATAGGTSIAITADVSSLPDMERMAQEAASALGSIDGLFANAGITGVGDAMSMDLQTWDRVIAINLTGVWLSNKVVLPFMVENGGGSIVNQASIGGLVGIPGIAPYAAAKAGVIGLTRQIAVEFGNRHVRVNALCPGTVPTPLVTATYAERAAQNIPTATGSMSAEEGLKNAVKRYPIGRLGTPEDIASFAQFLLSDETGWITGGVFAADGGYTAL
ncbi:MAG: SDR family NAD(P)-dependent oxidoreductase [Candidatus Binatia bacterium]|nr:SDR family NAD(P)-dependent oxidoreductase [Candidatus Binatia bacterium]